MNLTARMPSVVSPGKPVVSDDRSGKSEKPSPPGYSKEDYGQSWSSQEWKSGAAAHHRSGKPEKTSWDMMQQFAPHREEPLLDGNAHSVRYGEMIHDGSVKPDNVNCQEGADSETFVMGSDAAEFVNKVKDQMRSRQKRMSSIAENCAEHSIIWGMFMASTIRDYDGIKGEPTEFEWNIFPGFTTLQLCGKINDLLIDMVQTPETFTGRILFMSMFNDISCDRRQQR